MTQVSKTFHQPQFDVLEDTLRLVKSMQLKLVKRISHCKKNFVVVLIAKRECVCPPQALIVIKTNDGGNMIIPGLVRSFTRTDDLILAWPSTFARLDKDVKIAKRSWAFPARTKLQFL